MHFKSIIKCFKKWKYVNENMQAEIPYSFPPTDCSVIINHEPDNLFNGDIQSYISWE